jgi:hypothetical protein
MNRMSAPPSNMRVAQVWRNTNVTIGALKAVHERCHPGAGNRPPRPLWPSQEPLSGADDEDGIDGWDRQAAALLAELGDDEPDT